MSKWHAFPANHSPVEYCHRSACSYVWHIYTIQFLSVLVFLSSFAHQRDVNVNIIWQALEMVYNFDSILHFFIRFECIEIGFRMNKCEIILNDLISLNYYLQECLFKIRDWFPLHSFMWILFIEYFYIHCMRLQHISERTGTHTQEHKQRS